MRAPQRIHTHTHAQHTQEREPFISELLDALATTIADLQPHQIHSFYESVGLMIGAEGAWGAAAGWLGGKFLGRWGLGAGVTAAPPDLQLL